MHPQPVLPSDSQPPSLSLFAKSRDSGASRPFSLFKDTEQFLREIKPPTENNLSFEILGIPFKARHVPGQKNSTLVIWGVLGYLPYSVHSHQKRQALISILEATHRLPHVRFGVDPHMEIVVTGTYKISKPPAPDYIFMPLVRFLEESMPFVKLIGEYL